MCQISICILGSFKIVCLRFPHCFKKDIYLSESSGARVQVKVLWSCQFEAGYDTTPATEDSTSGLHL